MGLTAMLVGGISGTGIHMMNNALHKVPLSRREFLKVVMYVDYFVHGNVLWVLNSERADCRRTFETRCIEI
jgi:hypothetical protein